MGNAKNYLVVGPCTYAHIYTRILRHKDEHRNKREKNGISKVISYPLLFQACTKDGTTTEK